MKFKHFLKESGRDYSKKFKIYNDDSLSNYQEVDIETVRNIIVNKLSKILSEKPSMQGKTREEIEDSIRLREIKQSMGDLFVFKYSIFNRPLLPHSIHIDQKDWDEYEHDKADFVDVDGDGVPDDVQDEHKDAEIDSSEVARDADMPTPKISGKDIPMHDFGTGR
jgi:hypothetical protein